ncbi:MAG: hypothetical protein ABIT47_01105 [Candidatus Paceibacterota bacterium]
MEDDLEPDINLWNKPLTVVLDCFSKTVDKETNEQFKSAIVKIWLQKNNDALVKDVIAGTATFEQYLSELVRENLNITLENGTTPYFEFAAKVTRTIFGSIMPIENNGYDLTRTEPTMAEHKKMMLRFLLGIVLIGSFLGVCIGVTITSNEAGIIPGVLVSLPISILLWRRSRRQFIAALSNHITERKKAAEGLLEKATQFTSELRLCMKAENQLH